MTPKLDEAQERENAYYLLTKEHAQAVKEAVNVAITGIDTNKREKLALVKYHLERWEWSITEWEKASTERGARLPDSRA